MLLTGSFSFSFYTAQAHLPRDGIAHSELGPSTPVINQEMPHDTSPANQSRQFPNSAPPSQVRASLCQGESQGCGS